MASSARHVVIAGVSTRAAAESAARAGFEVTAIDAFADLDQHSAVRSLSLPRDFGCPFSAWAAARVSRGIECDAVAYLSSFENYPAAVGALTRRALWGNTPQVLRRVRDPFLFRKALADRGFTVPAVSEHFSPDRAGSSRWLVKARRSGGGRGVRWWTKGKRSPEMRVSRNCYLQEYIDGTPGSVVFVAAGGRTVPLGVCTQLIGHSAFGATGFQYCGNILASHGDPQFERGECVVDAACAIARAVGEEFGLVGVNGIDFVARDGVPFPIEVNPRWTASMELVERAFGLPVFGIHAAACEREVLPRFDLERALREVGSIGKAVLFARRDLIVGDTREWLYDPTVRDVPRPEERIAAGSPVCTVFAHGVDASECYAMLVRRAEGVYAELGTWAAVEPSSTSVARCS